MQTNALKLAQQNFDQTSPEHLRFDTIELQVTNLERATNFWSTILGFTIWQQDNDKATLGTHKKELLILHAGATRPVDTQHLGMCHVAFGLPTQFEFSRVLARLLDESISVSVVDHLMSKAIYLDDPDGIEFEFALETPERFGRFGDMSRGLIMYDALGQPHSGRETLNVSSELSYANEADLRLPLDEDTVIAHLHFQVADLETTTAWFERLGFARNLLLPDFGFADLGAGAAYTHRIAMNTWMGTNLAPTPDDMARLVNYTLLTNDLCAIESVNGLQKAELGLTGIDLTGTPICLRLKNA